MQIKTLIKDQTFVLKELSVTPRVQISTSAPVCALTPLQAFTPGQQGGIKLLLCTRAGKRHVLQLQGALSFTENIFKFLLGHLRQGKYSGCWVGGTTKPRLQIGLRSWRPALQGSESLLPCSNTQRYPVAPSKTLLHKTWMCQLYDRPCRAHSDSTAIFCVRYHLSQRRK